MGISNKHRFGEAIPMSRADIAAGTIGYEEYRQLSDIEQEKCLKRDYIWKAPNMKKLQKEHADMELVFWQNEIRKALSAKPTLWYQDKEYKDHYVQIVTTIRDLVMNTQTPGKIHTDKGDISFSLWAQDRFLDGRFILSNARCAVTPTLFIDWTPDKIKKSVRRARFGYTPEETARADADSRFMGFVYGGPCPKFGSAIDPTKIYRDAESWRQNDSKKCFVIGCSSARAYYYTSEEVANTITEDTAVIIDLMSRGIMTVVPKEDMDTSLAVIRQAYIRQVLDNKDQADTDKKRKHKFAPELAAVEQKNGYHRQNVTSSDYLEVFGFKGGEWGNWLNETERRQNLEMCFNSFKNLSGVLNIPDEMVSLDHMLSIAFGSRGHSSAAAHFEPGNNVINLTKMRGAGCLAHEWAHALDHYIAQKYNVPAEMATEAKIHYRATDPANAGKTLFVNLKDVLPAEFFQVLAEIRNAKDFNLGSKKFDEMFTKQGHGYWTSLCEMWARAFDCYVHDKLAENDIVDTYLSRGSDSFIYKEGDKIYRAYPVGEERRKISQAFDAMIKKLAL